MQGSLSDAHGVALRTILSGRVANRLGRAGIETVGQLVLYSAEDLSRMMQVGQGTIKEITTTLGRFGLTLAPDATPVTGPTLLERHRALLTQHEQLLALLKRIYSDPMTPPTMRAEITTFTEELDLSLTFEQAVVLERPTDRALRRQTSG
ncbi:DNA-directed RNA polymerase subunit alpha C-terminal domain-containing protein [Nocardia farcinica]|uniref:DNA-directed RNA polymerase subunit alpha C-terminal domain-containing protein n=1 Tax=Nocardia farcinica TaxID=37329 RepID=UPI0018947346|nr:DNA-directed RNA polymerase subunit alpha C-terminal domain-containing protein [Nocardia farcinica]MBF6188907.1 hypothetical protein [Nocardia farcinica]MBF6410456.1 hypothetical protein [Nocardia farcinica]